MPAGLVGQEGATLGLRYRKARRLHHPFHLHYRHSNSSYYGSGFACFLAPVGFRIPPNSVGAFLGLVFLAGMIISFSTLWGWKLKRRETTETINLLAFDKELDRGAPGPRRGYLMELGMTAALKKMKRDSKQGKKEYITEVKIISQLRHRNLVQLIGWCHDGVEFLLVYEFMPNGNLDSHLFGNKSLLTWAARNIKSSNVMVDSNFNVKLGDFGLAPLMDHHALGPQTTRLVGTSSHLAPEYISTGRATKESGVYSFGVVCLEIATGRKSAEMGLVELVWNLYGEEGLIVGVDERLEMNFDKREGERLMSSP
ncbi:hypothetical protein FNV43_RR18484 [Rhamnella rubrinervis]|uniref:Protein kinase domain-containing protein n=1 Tax=Rhamnella rubrinervis TaxID=2594499 RepID=A0A8K0GWG8_9ROSA|nr:hypothetical protein FNV43_RR18484 [Rhamnella rubrinervis]